MHNFGDCSPGVWRRLIRGVAYSLRPPEFCGCTSQARGFLRSLRTGEIGFKILTQPVLQLPRNRLLQGEVTEPFMGLDVFSRSGESQLLGLRGVVEPKERPAAVGLLGSLLLSSSIFNRLLIGPVY